jgi:hypothetical protein
VRLDAAGRFQLQARTPGYRLTVDGKNVVYCHSPGAALSYMAETLMADVDRDVALSLNAINEKLDYARRALDLSESVKLVCRALARAEKGGGDRRARVAAAALELSGAPNIDVFRNSNQAKEIANLAKVIIDTWSEEHEQRREEAAVRTSPAQLDQDL